MLKTLIQRVVKQGANKKSEIILGTNNEIKNVHKGINNENGETISRTNNEKRKMKEGTNNKTRKLWKHIIVDNTILICMLGGMFLLGRITHKPPNKDVQFTNPPEDIHNQLFKNSSETNQTSNASTSPEEKTQEQPTPTTTTTPLKNISKYVASKNGKRYYPIDCSAANRIHEENKIFFDTEEEAQQTGLTRTTSKSCDDLW